MNMSQIQNSVQRLVRNVLLVDLEHMDTNDNTLICDTLDFLNDYIEAINSNNTQTIQDYKEKRKAILQSAVFYEVLKCIYDPERLKYI